MRCPKCHTENPDTSRFCADCGTQLLLSKEIPVTATLETPTEELTRGTTFANRYEIIEELGKGGMGKVYRAEDKKIKEEVALKLIRPEIAADKKTIERFSNELKMARKIAHRNVCRMYDLGEEKGTHYITMEYVPGEDLKRLIRKVGQFSAGKAVSIAKQVCEGLAEAHRLGVVHRDLKPQNVMVDEEGNARIMDFGIARSVTGKGITGAGVMIGTPEYMSPEQAEVKDVDQRSDIYSLGVILYEMATGRVPFEGETPLGIAMKHKSEMPQDPREINSQIPEDLSRMILKCLQKDKEKRYQSAGEVRSELENIEKGIPTTERIAPKRKPITSREITVTFGLKKLFIPALIIIAILITTIVVWHPWSRKVFAPFPSDKPSLAVLYFKNKTGDENLDIWRTALPELITIDLSQSKNIQVLPSDRIYSILRDLGLLDAESYASEDLKKVASQGGVTHILQAILTKSGDSFRINYTLQETKDLSIVGADSVQGQGEASFHTVVDELTKKIKTSFQLTPQEIKNDIDLSISQIITSSPEAIKFWSEGKKYNNRGMPNQSVQLMEKALELDPEFAMAWAGMGIALSNLGYRDKAKKCLEKALELKERLPAAERYIIEGHYFLLSEKTYAQAIEAYKKVMDLNPAYSYGNNIGILFERLEEEDEAIKWVEEGIKRNPNSALAYGNLARIYMAGGLYEKAAELLLSYLNTISDSAMLRRYLARTYLCEKKFDMALVEADKAFVLDPSDWSYYETKGDICYCQGDLNQAEKEYRNLLDSKEEAGSLRGWQRLAYLELTRGRFDKSKGYLEQGLQAAEHLNDDMRKASLLADIAYVFLKMGKTDKSLEACRQSKASALEAESLRLERIALHYQGLCYLSMNSLDKARETAAELKALCQQGPHKKAVRYFYHLAGMIELEKKNFSEAIKLIKDSEVLLSYEISPSLLSSNEHGLFFNSAVQAYYLSGQLEKAKAAYERVISLTTGRIRYGDIYAKSFYMLGKIYEQQGNKTNAIEHYEKFLDLWKDADPGIDEVDDAMKKLSGLKRIP